MIKKQLNKLKENWLLILLFLVILFFVSGTNISTFDIGGVSDDIVYAKSMGVPMAIQESMMFDHGFAPEVADRKITKTSSISTEVEKGEFFEREVEFKAIVKTSDAILINEDVNTYDEVKQGNYQIKVVESKANEVLNQLKNIGEVTSFNENKRDITESYTSIEVELVVEKNRLQRFKEMYQEAKEINDKIQLNNYIFNQERTVKMLEDSLKYKDQKVDYTTIYFNMQEKRSEYVDIVLVKFSALVRGLVDSFNNLLYLLFVSLPYAIVVLIGWLLWRKFKR